MSGTMQRVARAARSLLSAQCSAQSQQGLASASSSAVQGPVQWPLLAQAVALPASTPHQPTAHHGSQSCPPTHHTSQPPLPAPHQQQQWQRPDTSWWHSRRQSGHPQHPLSPAYHPHLPTLIFSPPSHHHPASHTQIRSYTSKKKSRKPVYAKASKLAVQPYLDSSLMPPLDPKEQKFQEAIKKAPIVDTALPEVPKVEVPPECRRVGQITGSYSLDLQPQFAVVAVRGTQFKVTTDDIIFVGHLKEAGINEVVSLDQVLLLGGVSSTVVGRPYLTNACVLAAVEEHFRDGIVSMACVHLNAQQTLYHVRHANSKQGVLLALQMAHRIHTACTPIRCIRAVLELVGACGKACPRTDMARQQGGCTGR